MSYADIEMKVIQWGEKRKIVQNSTAFAQALKTKEKLAGGIRSANADMSNDNGCVS